MRIAFTHNLQTQQTEDQAEFDTPATMDALRVALSSLGHDVRLVEVSGPASRLVARLEVMKPDLIFNTAEGSRGRYREAFYPALFEQLGFPFTGSGAYACALTLDKRATKALLSSRGVPTPAWRLVEHGDTVDVEGLRFPLIVKPNFEGSSKGIDQDSVVETFEELHARIAQGLALYETGLLVEEFIIGHDVTVPFLAGTSPDTGGVLTPSSYSFDERVTGPRKYEIYDYTLKTTLSDAVQVTVPAPYDDDVLAKLRSYTQIAMSALAIEDLGRADFRVTPDGEIYFIEVNALPSLEPGASMYKAAALAGLKTIPDVLECVVRTACERQKVAPVPALRSERLRLGLAYNLKRTDTALGSDAEAEFDSESTIASIRDALTKLGHDVVDLEANAELLSVLPGLDIDVVFNIAEGIGGRSREAQVPAILELLGIEYTGSDATTMSVTLDKGLAKRIVSQADVSIARFILMRTGDEALPPGWSFPAVVKPNAEGSSKGVAGNGVVHNEAELRKAAKHMIVHYRQAALVEEFLEGREFSVGVLGDHTPRVLPPMEIVFEAEAGRFPVYSYEHKQETKGGVRYEIPANVDELLGKEIERVALTAFEALGCRDVARIDLRLDGAGRVNFIECNPLPGLSPGYSDLCLIGEACGLDHSSLIAEVLSPALRRLATRRMEQR
ncbi:MAG: D-alanine-D-alanine ligase [Polyangiales bacterium]|jgi:D-alanine-D-alanine ligase